MRQGSSYRPIDTELHYHVPRQALIEFAGQQLPGQNLDQGGHDITGWAAWCWLGWGRSGQVSGVRGQGSDF